MARLLLIFIFFLGVFVFSQQVFAALQTKVDVSTVKELETTLSRIEEETVNTSGFDKKRVFGVTFPFQSYVTKTSVGQGKTHIIYPAALAKAITDLLKQGKDKKSIGQTLVEYDQSGKLAKMARQ